MNKKINIPKIRLRINKKNIEISDLTNYLYLKLNKKDARDYLFKNYIVVKDKQVKLLLINLAMLFFENYSYKFKFISNIIPFFSSDIIIEREIFSQRNPSIYFGYLVKNLKEEWFVNFSWEGDGKYPKDDDFFRGATNYPSLIIYPKSKIFPKKEHYNNLKQKYTDILEEYISKNYKCKFDQKTNKLSGNVILLRTGGGLFDENLYLTFAEYYLLTPNIVTYAFLGQLNKLWLQDGIYKIESDYIKKISWHFLLKSGFIIKKATLLKTFEDQKFIKNKNFITSYCWDYRIKLRIFLRKIIKKQLRELHIKLVQFVKLILYIIIVLLLLSGILGSIIYFFSINPINDFIKSLTNII